MASIQRSRATHLWPRLGAKSLGYDTPFASHRSLLFVVVLARLLGELLGELGGNLKSGFWIGSVRLNAGVCEVWCRNSLQVFPFLRGYVPDAGHDFSPTQTERVFSASGLETAGQCPLKYFFSYALYVRPLEELVVDPERWLDALNCGKLLHSVFRQFMSELRARDEIPEFVRDQKRLAEILRLHIQKYRDAVPPPNEAAYRKQCRELTEASCTTCNQQESRRGPLSMGQGVDC